MRLCGRATLASAKVLYARCENRSAQFRFQTLGGELLVERLLSRTPDVKKLKSVFK